MQMGSLRPERVAQDPAASCRHSPGHRDPLAPQLAEGRVRRRGSWMGRLGQATGDGRGCLVRRGTNEAWEGAGAEQGCAPKSGRGPGEAEGTAVQRRISGD